MNYTTEEKVGKDGVTRVLMLPDWSSLNQEHALEKVRGLCREYLALAENIDKEKPSFERLVVAVEDIDDRVAQIVEPINELHLSMRIPVVVDAAHAVNEELTRCHSILWSHPKFYRAYQSFRRSRAYRALDKEQKSAFDIQIQMFNVYGFNSTPKYRALTQKLEHEIEVLEELFVRNVRHVENLHVRINCTETTFDGLPDDTVAHMRAQMKTDGVNSWIEMSKVSLSFPIKRFATDRSLREAMYKSDTTNASDIGETGPEFDNRPVAEKILKLRHQLARLRGKKNHAELRLEGRMAGSPKVVKRFLDSVRGDIVQNAKEEVAKLTKFAAAKLGHTLEPWDVEYAKNLFLKKHFGFTSADLKPYLNFPQVLKALFNLAEKMYGIKIIERTNVSVWHPDVRFFEVSEQSGNLLGAFYLDAFGRTGQATKADYLWTQNLLTRRRITVNKIRLPLVAVHLGITKEERPAKIQAMSHEDAIGLFHEFGHLLQYVLIDSNYLATGPDNIEWDVIEIPSMLMENWAWDIETLADMTWDKKKRKSAPLKLLLAIHRQRSVVNAYGGWSLFRDLEESIIDFELHTKTPGKDFVGRTVRRVRRELGVFPVCKFSRFPNSHTEIFGDSYDMGSYGYLWSRCFAAAIRMEHLKRGYSVCPIVSRKFRREFLEASRIRMAKQNLTAFFGRKLPSSTALLKQGRFV